MTDPNQPEPLYAVAFVKDTDILRFLLPVCPLQDLGPVLATHMASRVINPEQWVLADLRQIIAIKAELAQKLMEGFHLLKLFND